MVEHHGKILILNLSHLIVICFCFLQVGLMDKGVFAEIEIAAYLGMSRSYLRKSRIDGNRANLTPAPPFIRIGRSIRYLKEDLDLWLDGLPKYQKLNQASASKQGQYSADLDWINQKNSGD